jgi:hypothetical protein
MAAYPQLGSGALSQFPVQKTRRARTVVNVAADGRRVFVGINAKITEMAALPAERNMKVNAEGRAWFDRMIERGIQLMDVLRLPKRKRRIIGNKIIPDGRFRFDRWHLGLFRGEDRCLIGSVISFETSAPAVFFRFLTVPKR